MANQMNYVELGLAGAEACATLDRGLSGLELNDLDDTVCEAIEQTRMAVAETERAIKPYPTVSYTHAIVSGLERNARSTDTMGSYIHRTILKGHEGGNLLTETSIPGEFPPPTSRIFFGRNELIEKIVDLAENLTPIALIGAGGIGKTSIALNVLHHDRIKQRFGHDRRFIRCDLFPPSCANFLRQLSKVIGARVKNPENLSSLQTVLSSKEMVIVLDNAESILDPQGTDAREIYDVVQELCQFENICICITSRISIPIECERLEIPTLSMDAAFDTFYRIYQSDTRSDVVNGIIEQLEFHPLSITLLATVARHDEWSLSQLTMEWSQRRTRVLKTRHNKSLAASIEASLTSPLFQELGPDARALLEVVAFFPQGVDENNLDWLFPTIPNRTDIFNTFCILSLTYRSNGFVTMLAPFRDHLCPKDPRASPLLCATKEHYFARMSVDIDPNDNFEETRWIVSEDINVEHLLDVFTMIDEKSDDVWSACANFITYLHWHKPRPTILKPKIEGLPDDHRLKPECLCTLSQVFSVVGNDVEHRRLLSQALDLWREWGDEFEIAETLMGLSDANWHVGLYKEGIPQAEEALATYERLGETERQADCLIRLGRLFGSDKQLDAAEEAVLRAINLLPQEDELFRVCQAYQVLGNIYRSKGEIERAIQHFEAAIGIASSFNWRHRLFWIHFGLVVLFCNEGRFDDAQTHIEHAKSHTGDDAYTLCRVKKEQAWIWYKQGRFEEARSEALRVADIYEKLEAAKALEDCREFLWDIEEKLSTPVASG